MASPSNLLTEEHLAQINEALDKAKAAEQEIKLATMAGIDVAQQAAELKANVDRLHAIKQVYFPGR